MTFKELKKFLIEKMRMSHIYQPIVIKFLIDSGGHSTIRQLALEFLSYDESQILYYEKILKNMPLKILSKHNIIQRDGELISLNTKKLNLGQKTELKKVCEDKIQEFIFKRGYSIWDHRLFDKFAISDSLRYQVLKESNGRCALCGITSKERSLDIDHIIPISRGGKSTYDNFQVLCSKCNRAKGNKDDTDFRKLKEQESLKDCIFCKKQSSKDFLIENELAYAIRDGYPVSKYHSLIIPKRHMVDYFSLSRIEINAVNELLNILRKRIIKEDCLVKGFNIGSNSGEMAGQTIMHCHIHLIPRREGDTEDPKGGVRGVIPNKMHYYECD